MKITNVRTIQLVRPLDQPLRNARGAMRERRFTFVLVETDRGLTGIGDAFGDQAIMEPIIERRLGPMVIGLDPTDIGAVWRKLFASRPFWETGGSVVCGISAIEVACWDVWGQSEGVPVCELLGGRKRERVTAYASDLHWAEPQPMAELAHQYVEQGFQYVKTHIGAPGEDDRDLDRLAAMRRAIGSDVGLMIDVNTGFDRRTALERGRSFATFDPFWYEEPLPPLDFQGHAWLREQLPLRITTGENLYLTEGFEPLWACRGCDYVMPDILRCGGLEQAKRICETAIEHGIVPSPHNYSSGVGLAATLHLMSTIPNTELLEFDPTGTAIYEDLFIDPLIVEDGQVQVPSAVGLGVQLTTEIVEKWQRRGVELC